MNKITINGARLHNLKGIDLSIPKNKLVVATGVSGSGKSSLMFDIVFKEGRRQYLQSLGILTGLDDEEKFDNISGIGPTIAVQQSVVRQSNPRSTVGSRTGILNMISVLFAREGQILCASCGTPVDDSLNCKACGYMEERLPVSYFSYNHPNGMCIKCSGRGTYYEFNMDKLVPNDQITLKEIFDQVELTPGFQKLVMRKFGEHFDTPFVSLPDEVKYDVLYGHNTSSSSDKRSFCLARLFQGKINREGGDLNGIYSRYVCSDCHGYRVGEEARRVRLNGKHIGELAKMTISELKVFLETLLRQGTVSQMGKTLLEEILKKIDGMVKTRLGHLTLYREMPTLSGGEMQRLFLNTHLESKMDSLIYVLDEPTVGLHESEKSELLKSINDLKNIGNTVLVVEHDRNVIQMADHIIDIGPKAGVEGGQIVYQGDYSGLLKCKDSITGLYLSGQIAMPTRTVNQEAMLNETAPCLTIRNVKTNNLKDVTVSFPLGVLVGVAGVSGSGKSSLVSDTLIRLLKTYFHGQGEQGILTGMENETDEIDNFEMVDTIADSFEGVSYISGFAEVSQAPIGKSANSNPATYMGIWDKIRKLFANQPESAVQGFTPGDFSFNSKGACPQCGGKGVETIWLGGNLSIDHICGECQGKRYNNETLSIKYKGKDIHEILEMSVSEAVHFFENDSNITSILKVLERIGMGYIKLGQPTSTLSGGEAQRVKLAKEIGKRRKGHILYVLDEPTTGLSLYDTAKLIELLDELVSKGNSVVVIEHDRVVLDSCDWIIELGPKGGTEGGEVIAEGTPEMIKNNPASISGRYL